MASHGIQKNWELFIYKIKKPCIVAEGWVFIESEQNASEENEANIALNIGKIQTVKVMV